MPTWFYYDNNGQKKGPITSGQLKGLAKTGTIMPGTMIESDTGKKSVAAKLQGLTFPHAERSEPPSLETSSENQNPFIPSAISSAPVAVPPLETDPVTSPDQPKQVASSLLISPKMVSFVCVTLAFAGVSCFIYYMLGGFSGDRSVVKRDLQEISEYDAWNDDMENVTKYMDVKRAEHFEIWKRAAEKGIPEGQVLFGWCYLIGKGVPEDSATGAMWYRKAAEQGNTEGQYRLGLCYSIGVGVPKESAESLKWIRQAAEGGSVGAQMYLVAFHAKNKAETVKWLRKVAEKEHTAARFTEMQYQLGLHYFLGDGIPEDKQEAVKWFLKVAQKGHIKGQLKLAECYYDGIGIKENRKEAVKWYESAASQASPEAWYRLGECYFYGWGVSVDKAKAVDWYRKAADKNDADAQYRLGLCCRDGEGVAVNQAEAKRWLGKAAEKNNFGASAALKGIDDLESAAARLREQQDKEDDAAKVLREKAEKYRQLADQGDVRSQYDLAICYYNGEGVSKDEEQAAQWMRRSAEGGFGEAQYQLAVRLHSGSGMPQDLEESIRWLRGASEKGHSEAQYQLGIRYRNGEGVEKDSAEAVRWFKMAQDRRHPRVTADFIQQLALEAAEQGDAESQYQQGLKLQKAGGSQNDKEAAQWFLKAAEQGHADAQYEIGNCYFTGKGIAASTKDAAPWLRKAEAQGHKDAIQLLKNIQFRYLGL